MCSALSTHAEVLSRRRLPKTKVPFEHLEEIAIHSFYARTVALFHTHVEEILPTWSVFGWKPNTNSTAFLIQSSWPSLTVVLTNFCCISVNVDLSSVLIARLCCSRSSLNSGLWYGFQPPRRGPAALPQLSSFGNSFPLDPSNILSLSAPCDTRRTRF
jgi:hypothetical protein